MKTAFVTFGAGFSVGSLFRCLLVLPCLFAVQLARAGEPFSAAMTNVADAASAWAAHAGYTNNVLRIETASPVEWDVSNPRHTVDRFPANMPFQLVVGTAYEDRLMAERALRTSVDRMPSDICAYFMRHRLLAPLQQWLIRRSHPSVTNEESYLSVAAHPAVWQAKDFDLDRLGRLAASLTSNSVPVLAVLQPIYEGYKGAPIKFAEPFVDYPDPRTEETYATPFGISVVLRAMENRRKFRFLATGYPFGGRNVSYKWIALPPRSVSIGGYPAEDWNVRRQLVPERGYGEIVLGWGGAERRDVLVFARYGEGAYGPPSVISFYRVPNERRRYDRKGRIESIEYLADKAVIPWVYQNKPWKDLYMQDSLGNVIGFQRMRTGIFEKEHFSSPAEFVTETYPGDLPKTTKKVRYFTRPEEPATLDFEVTDETVGHKMQSFELRDRGEFPSAGAQRRRRR